MKVPAVDHLRLNSLRVTKSAVNPKMHDEPSPSFLLGVPPPPPFGYEHVRINFSRVELVFLGHLSWYIRP